MSDGSTDSFHFVTDQEAILKKKSTLTLVNQQMCLQVLNVKKNRTSRILYGQVTFFRQLVQGQAGHFRISPPLHYNIQLFVLSSEFSVSMLVKTVNDATPCYKTFNLDMNTKHY